MINYTLFILLHMLKTSYGNTVRLITQPNHAVAAGYMASHWGNKETTFITNLILILSGKVKIQGKLQLLKQFQNCFVGQ